MVIAANLRAILLAMYGLYGWAKWPIPPLLRNRVHARFNRIVADVTRLAARYQAGAIRPRTPRAPTISTTKAPVPRKQPQVRFSRRFGWLGQMGGHNARCFGGQLQHQLSQPEMAAFLEAVPRAKQILRPMCRAYGIELPWTIDKPRPPRPRKPRMLRRIKRYPNERPLPRGAIAMAKKYREYRPEYEYVPRPESKQSDGA
jgi:hypothetical protein